MMKRYLILYGAKREYEITPTEVHVFHNKIEKSLVVENYKKKHNATFVCFFNITKDKYDAFVVNQKKDTCCPCGNIAACDGIPSVASNCKKED